ncbi:hypothetical protein B0H11DRAFT_63608 [Mycena galericulata]|nr:hypothetical protein B0H11DRAFT_63608 [Mycena galericulata]
MDSLTSELLSTNLPPTERQRHHVRQLILERQQTALDLSYQYAAADNALRDILFRHQQAHREIALLNAVISPLRHLPTEILAEIFKICVAQSRFLNMFDYSIDNPRTAPILLTHVCSLWRHVAITTPRLWDRLSLRSPSAYPMGKVPLIADLVNRSHPHWLVVEIRTSSRDIDDTKLTHSVLPALVALPQFRDRVESLELGLDIRTFPAILSLSTPNLPRLRTLDLSLSVREDWQPSVAAVLEFFRSSQRLRELKLFAYYANSSADFAPLFPWSQLTRLVMSIQLDFLVARTILARCTNLRDCFLEDLLHEQDSDDDLPICTLPKLWRLTVLLVSSSTAEPSSVFFKAFSFPNLRDLTVDIYGWPEDALFALQERSHFTLTSLSLRNIILDAAVVVRILESNPTIEDLSLHEFTDQSIINALTYSPPQSSVLLPRLTCLWIESSHRLTADGDDLVRMLESRWDPHLRPPNAPSFAQLTQVNLVLSCPPLSPAAEATIQHMDSVGLLHDHMPRE